MRPTMATHRSADWRYLLQLVGTVLTIGGGIIAVSSPAIGGTVVALGLLALLGAGVE